MAIAYAQERQAFGRPIIDHQGLAFILADMAAAVESARATYLHAARLRDAGRTLLPSGVDRQTRLHPQRHEGHHRRRSGTRRRRLPRDFPVERYIRETKVMQIFEGTNQIQRLVISRDLNR